MMRWFAWMLLVWVGACAPLWSTDPYTPLDRGEHSPGVPRPALSPLQEHEGPLTLEHAIEVALAHHPEIAALGWEARAAEARQSEAFGERLPRLRAVGGYSHHVREQRVLPVGQPGDPAALSRDIVAGDLLLSLPLFTGGRLIHQVKSADLLRDAAMHRLARSREELVFNVSSLFYVILAQRHVIASLEFSLRTLEDHAERIDALVAAQRAARVDRMRTDVRVAEVRQQLVRERNLLAVQRRLLANLLGLGDHAGAITLDGDLDPHETAVLPELEAALATAWRKRGDYLAARSSLEAQASSVDAARSGHWPVLSLEGAYGGRWAVGPLTGEGDAQGDVGHVGVVMEVPIFEGGRVSARVREQRAGLAAAQERLRLLELQVRLEVETALLNVESSSERAAAIRASMDHARESLRIEQEKYALGRGAIVDVLDAQAALLETETAYYLVLAEWHAARAQLKLAMGEE